MKEERFLTMEERLHENQYSSRIQAFRQLKPTIKPT